MVINQDESTTIYVLCQILQIMGCEPIKPIEQSDVDINAELTYQYDRLRLIFNNDEEHPYIKGFKHCMDIISNNNIY